MSTGTLLWSLLRDVFVLVLLGAVLARLLRGRAERVVAVFIRAVIYVLIPAFVFLSIWTSRVSLLEARRLIAASVAVLAGGAFLAWGWARLRKVRFEDFCLPVIFMNSGYLAIPVNTLLWGSEGATYAIIYNTVVTVAQFTFGVWCMRRESALVSIAGMPAIYAVAGGAALNLLSVDPPGAAIAAGRIVQGVTLPVMLLFLGYRIGEMRMPAMRLATAGVALRMGGGLLLSVGAVAVLGLEGVAAGVCVMTSVMPSAVNAYVFAEYFEGNASLAAAAVLLSTLLSFAVIPLVGYLLLSVF